MKMLTTETTCQPTLSERKSEERTLRRRLIEDDSFPFEFLSGVAERESWRKEIHRPIYHMHKWWAKRLGSVFRGILLGSVQDSKDDLERAFYSTPRFPRVSVFDPFMGSGTTIGEAHKLGMQATGCDINPVAAESVRVALGELDRGKLEAAFESVRARVSGKILALYTSRDSQGRPCEVLYYFWVMQGVCPSCDRPVDLFSSWVIARNAYPSKRPEIQILCPECGEVFEGRHDDPEATCPRCTHHFVPQRANASGSNAICPHCESRFAILGSVGHCGHRPDYRLYAKLVLTADGKKEYLPADDEDINAFRATASQLAESVRERDVRLPDLVLRPGQNTSQSINYGFLNWRDFFNDRQLLALGWLQEAIAEIEDESARDALLLLFSGTLEFNNMFASYKGEGTGAVRHMFSHHILKPERTPIEANVWGTPKSSGSFSGLFKRRILKALDYRANPTEVGGSVLPDPQQRPALTGSLVLGSGEGDLSESHPIRLVCGDSSSTRLATGSVDLVVTDPPFFDNVHYSELADFFYAWQQLVPRGFVTTQGSTRAVGEVQDADSAAFAGKLESVFGECRRVLRDDGLLVFTYHHSRAEGWESVARAVLDAGFVVVNAHPVKAEMSVGTPKSQAKEPIQLDSVLVCRKSDQGRTVSFDVAVQSARRKIERLESVGTVLSANDRKVVIYGQMLTALNSLDSMAAASRAVEHELSRLDRDASPQLALLSDGGDK